MKSITELINESLALRDKKWRANKKAIKNPHEYLINKQQDEEDLNYFLKEIKSITRYGFFMISKAESESGWCERYIVTKENLFQRIINPTVYHLTDEMQKDILNTYEFKYESIADQKTFEEIMYLLNVQPLSYDKIKYIYLPPNFLK